MNDAADTLAAQQTRIAELEAALRPFTKAAGRCEGKPDYGATLHSGLTIGDLQTQPAEGGA